MAPPTQPPTPESLLAHREWLRAIARALVADESRVDDVEQRAWLIVMRNQHPVRSVRSWLRRVVQSAAVDEHRTEQRRHRREEAAARAETLPPTDHLVAQAEAHYVVARAVTALPEPYRTTVLLRYFEGLAISEVAERMACPSKTVQTRLTRAHALLRDALDRKFGDRHAWCLALLPLSRMRGPIPIGTITSGVAIMAGKGKVAAAAAALLLLMWGAWWASNSEPIVDGTEPGLASASNPAKAPRRTAAEEPSVSAEPVGWPVGVDVIDFAGHPVGDAAVELDREQQGAGSLDEDRLFLGVGVGREKGSAVALTTRTGPLGAASFDAVPDAAWRLRVHAIGYAAHEERLAVSGATVRRRVVLRPACALEGTVRRGDGEPAAAAVVHVGGQRAIASAEGSYRFNALAPGPSNVRVEFGGVVQDLGGVALPDVAHLDLRLRGGCSLRGRVIDAETGVPISGARVSFSGTVYADLPRMLGFGARAVSDSDGHFAWTDLPSGIPNFVWVEHDDYAASRGEPELRPPGAHLVAHMAVECEVRMTRGALVRGRVVAEDGSPVSGAVVDVWTRVNPREQVRVSAPAVAGADGAFRLHAHPGTGLVRARAPGVIQRGFPGEPWSALRDGLVPPACAVVVTAGEESVVEVRMERTQATAEGGALRGVVRREDGRPADGVLVSLVREGSYGARPVLTPVDERGAFRFDGLAAANYVLQATADGCAPARLESLAVPSAGTLEGVDVVLAEEKTIGGRVVDESGGPIAGAEIGVSASQWERAGPAVATTATDGTFLVRRLTAGTWFIDARAAGFATRSVTAVAGTSEAQVRLERALTITGTAFDADTGAPLVGVPLHATFSMGRTDANRNMIYRETASGPDGSFVLSGLAPDTYRVQVGPVQQSPPWGAGEYVLSFIDGVRAGTTGLRVPVTRGLAITGRVVDESGAPAPGGVVDALEPVQPHNPRRDALRRTRVRDDGTFRIPGLPQGTYDLTAGGAQGTSGPVLAEAVPAGATNVVIRLRGPLVITGRLMLEDGKPYASHFGSLEFRSVGQDGMQTVHPAEGAWSSDGRFRSNSLEPDRSYDVVFSGAPGYVGALLRGVRPGAAEVELIVRKGGTITGRVLETDGRPVPEGVTVSAHATDADGTGRLLPLPGDYAHATVGADGSFVLCSLGDRTYQISAGGDPSPFLSTSHAERFRPGATGVEIRLRRGATLSGRLLDANGVPLRTGFVQVYRHGTLVPVDEQGRFTIRALEPGRHPVFAQLGERIVSVGEVTVPSDGVELTVRGQ